MYENILFIFYCLSGIILNTFCVYFFYDILGKKLEWKNAKVHFIIVLMTVICVLLNLYCAQPYRFLLSFAFLTVFCLILTGENIGISLTIMLLLELDMVFSEMIFVGIVNFVADYHSMLVIGFSNIMVPLIGLLILKSKVFNKAYILILKIIKTMKYKEFLTYSLMVLLIILFSTIESYMNLPLSIVLVTNTLMAMVLISIIFKFVTTKSNYQNISSKYQMSITSLKEYETMIDKFRVNNHENKNELMTIRNMIKNNDKKTIEYIDALVDNKINDNENIMYKTSKIPEGGLRATIYSKLCVMDKYKINYKLDIAKDVRTVDLINLSDEIILNVCKILGVFLDNSIEAVRKLKKKDIEIELYVIDNEMYIDITNNFNGNLNINKIGNEKYTTKGTGHGYGLLLVSKIISENNDVLKNETSINGNNFTQSLRIKI